MERRARGLECQAESLGDMAKVSAQRRKRRFLGFDRSFP